ncbi:MAG TPA: hypothetical protein VE136_10415 [Anaerolineales bacterium]|nr:hypothetical protein [Anaerolineales bacterium]
MDTQRLSGIIISSGFVLYVLAMLAAPQLYQESVIANRLAIIAANRIRWNVSQLFFALGMGVPAAGFLLFGISQRIEKTAWLLYLGMGTLVAGAAIGMWLIYRQTLDPAAFWEGAQIPLIIGYGYLLLTSIGLLCFGIAILQGGFPTWLGYLMAGSAVTFSIAVLALRGGGGFFISILIYLVAFIAGIVIWRG